MATVFNLFLERVNADPRAFTYIGVGTNPHARTVEELTDEWDQLVPLFVREQNRKAQRIIHFDPAFNSNIDFIKEYFTRKFALIYSEPTLDRPYHSWTSSRLEVLLSTESLDYKSSWYPEQADHEWFLTKLTTAIIDTGGHLVLQDFSGHDPLNSFKRAYEVSPKPHLFKRRILFDITYGKASCQTDLTVHKPIYNRHGDFINFTLFSSDEIHENIGFDQRLDALIKEYFLTKFRATLNHHHVNYRRRVNGDDCLTTSEFYDKMATPSLIMEVLQGELKEYISIFKNLGLVDKQKETLFRNLMDNYTTINMYNWNTQVNNLF
jgi:hypothetical protein